MGRKKAFPKGLRYQVPIYGFWIYFAFDKVRSDTLMDWFNTSAPANNAGYCIELERDTDGDTRFVVAVTRVRDDAEWMITASHECLHAAYFILAKVGVTHTRDNHEALAYLHSDIFSEMMRQYADWKKQHAD